MRSQICLHLQHSAKQLRQKCFFDVAGGNMECPWSSKMSLGKCHSANVTTATTTSSGFGLVESARNNVPFTKFPKVGTLIVLTTEVFHFTGTEKGELLIEKNTLKPYCIIKLRSRLYHWMAEAPLEVAENGLPTCRRSHWRTWCFERFTSYAGSG